MWIRTRMSNYCESSTPMNTRIIIYLKLGKSQFLDCGNTVSWNPFYTHTHPRFHSKLEIAGFVSVIKQICTVSCETPYLSQFFITFFSHFLKLFSQHFPAFSAMDTLFTFPHMHEPDHYLPYYYYFLFFSLIWQFLRF